jgi:hypothetical protein
MLSFLLTAIGLLLVAAVLSPVADAKKHRRHHLHSRSHHSSAAAGDWRTNGVSLPTGSVTNSPRLFWLTGVEGGVTSPPIGRPSRHVYGAHKTLAATPTATNAVNSSVYPALDINSAADAATVRANLVQYIWKGAGFPTSGPTSVTQGVSDSAYSNLTSLQRIDKISVSMEYGVTNKLYLFLPTNPINKLIIFANGHDGGPEAGHDAIQYWLTRGYTVLENWMPLQPEYPALERYPVVSSRDLGTFTLWSHYYLGWIDSDTFSPIKFFVEPVARSLNYLTQTYSFNQIAMMGLSGGGWTTTLYAALDTRIQKSYSVAGSLPFYLRNEYNPGDWEQYVGALYHTAEYTEMYLLGAYGVGRNQLQILNSNDPCCFSYSTYATNPYESYIQQRLVQLGQPSTTFRVLKDDNNNHSITANALSLIAADLNQ